MGRTPIQWTDFSTNPFRARLKIKPPPETHLRGVGHFCVKISPGCAQCYASGTQVRFGLPPYEAKYADLVEPYFDPEVLKEVLGRKAPTRWFWWDMTDAFGEWVPDAWLDTCLAVMAQTPQHTHQVLTKRSDRMLAYFTTPGRDEAIDQEGIDTFGWCHSNVEGRWPLPNVHLGVSCETRDYLDRLDHLRVTPAAKRFVSFEPLLEDLDDVDLMGIDQAIYGGESNRTHAKARPCDVAWIRRGLASCRKSGTAAFVKQLGARPVTWAYGDTHPDEEGHAGAPQAEREEWGQPWPIRLAHPKGGDWDEWTGGLADLRVRELLPR